LKVTVQAAQKSALQMVLDELEELHREETVALRSMSRERIDDLTDRKLTLWERLRAVSVESPPGPEQRASLERIKRAALLNQILLHHARDAVRTILQNASGQSLAPATMRPAAVAGGMRVDFRG
jgi:hypothetical protein